MNMEGLISVVQAAEKLKVSRVRVLQLITEGRLPASRIGQAYVINEADLALVADRKAGRPKSEAKPKNETKKKGKK